MPVSTFRCTRHPHSGGLGRGVQLLGVGAGEHRLGDGKLREAPRLLRRGVAEDEDLPVHARPAQLHGLLQIGDPEPGCAASRKALAAAAAPWP